MADDDTDTKVEDKSAPDPTPLPDDLDKITPKHLADLETKLRKELGELGVQDAKEKAEIRAELEELKEYKRAREAADEAKEKTQASDTTMVLPPADIPPQQPNPAPSPAATEQGEGKKKSRWKGVW